MIKTEVLYDCFKKRPEILCWSLLVPWAHGESLRIVGEKAGNIDLEEFLSRPLFAHLSTNSESGPRDSPVWFLWRNGVIWIMGNPRENSFQHRIERDPRCTVGIVHFDVENRIVQHVGFRGHAAFEPFDGKTAHQLFSKHLGEREESWDMRFKESLEDSDAFLVKFTPETAVVRDQSYPPVDG